MAAASSSDSMSQCPHSLSLSSKQSAHLISDVAVAWSGQLVFDIVVFVLTAWKSCYLRTPGRGTVANVFLRDGAMLAAANGVNIVVLLSDCLKGSTGGCTNVLSATLMSRLMFNLRDTNRPSPETRLFLERSSTLAFAGNPGNAEIELGTVS
ncbi:hypothetical protein SCLCIDRAFT_1217700 [Scleroderma citrinum Foug A]|uniref:Uncharacterized protein n=1 Tax=Scleroderma citrinum Foug A TaxID=1036808 RepID=A0A0C3DF69_9AGAM|nr:hypothetical protein SCLCIDRAFT_1217700 [Scleroderma citrinum Foug A]